MAVNKDDVSSVVSASNGASSRKGPVVCVLNSCGASDGTSSAHRDAAQALAHALHKNEMSLVYGGGTVGLMGEVARILVSLSGPSSVHGIIPEPLVKHEQRRTATTEIDPALYGSTTVVSSMHIRKRNFVKEVIEGGPGGGFVALSGGYGTLEELMEVTTWNQLGIHDKPVVLYNVEGYWDGLIQWIRAAVSHGFVKKGVENIIVEAKTADEVIACLKEYKKADGRFDLQWDQE